jgi:F-type H+-transporting ATPase subunit b
MPFDWTTFTLEIINFLVLVWLLKRLIYQPVIAALDARQERVRAESARATEALKNAESLKQQYESRLIEWNREREQQLRKLDEEVALERNRRLEKLKRSLVDEESKARARGLAAAASAQAAIARKSSKEAFGAAAAMLRRLGSPELTERIAGVFLEDLGALEESSLTVLRQAATRLGKGANAVVVSAHPIEERTRSALAAALSRAAGVDLDVEFKSLPELLAGLRVAVGECLLQANLADELAVFRERGASG